MARVAPNLFTVLGLVTIGPQEAQVCRRGQKGDMHSLVSVTVRGGGPIREEVRRWVNEERVALAKGRSHVRFCFMRSSGNQIRVDSYGLKLGVLPHV